MNSKTVYNESDLNELLKNPPKELIQKGILHISNYIFEDENLKLDRTIISEIQIHFTACKFVSKDGFLISGITCKKPIRFKDCDFTNGITFFSGIFEESVIIENSNFNSSSIEFMTGTFKLIDICSYNIKDVDIYKIKFEDLKINKLQGNNIRNLYIFADEENTGEILIENQAFEEFHLSGVNKGKSFKFSNIDSKYILLNHFTNNGNTTFTNINSSGEKSYFEINESRLDQVQFYRVSFSNFTELILIDSFIINALFISCNWSKNLKAIHSPRFNQNLEFVRNGENLKLEEKIAIKEAYRQLKISMSLHHDKIQEKLFYSEELNFHNQTLHWTHPLKNDFWDKLILFASKIFSDFGQSFLKPTTCLLVGHFVLFLSAICFGGFSNFCNYEDAFEKFFLFINPLRDITVSFSGYLIIIDLIMRIWSSYMIYNIIRATRRFIF